MSPASGNEISDINHEVPEDHVVSIQLMSPASGNERAVLDGEVV